MENIEEYPYAPLPGTRCIRVLRPERSMADRPSNDTLRCTIELLDLDDEDILPYTCLSYTWGHPVPPDDSKLDRPPPGLDSTIVMDGHRHTITSVLHAALCELFRAANEDSSAELFWVDALCIDQASDSERSAQVAIMADIYSLCSHIVVWFGPLDAHAEIAIPLFVSLALALRALPSKDDFFLMASALSFNDPRFWQTLGHRPLTIPEWASILQFLRRSWWSRLWILQEAILAPAARGQCGNMEIPPTYCAEVAELIMLGNLEDAVYPATGVPGPSCSPVFEIGASANILNKGLTYPKQRQLHERYFGATTDSEHLASFCGWIWTSNRQRKASDPRDKIFAPLAIASRLKHAEMDKDFLNNWIIPDYSKSIPEVYTEAANFLLRETRSLSLLSYVEDKSFRSQQNLPSWIPDWTVMEAPTSINRWYGLFDASKGWDYMPEELDSQATLLPLTGCHIDTIDHTFPTALNAWPFASMLCNPSSHNHAFASSNPISKVDLLARTLAANTFNHAKRPLSAPPVPYEEYIQSFGSWILFELASATLDHGQDLTEEQIASLAVNFWMQNQPLMHLLSSPPLRILGEHLVSYFLAFHKARTARQAASRTETPAEKAALVEPSSAMSQADESASTAPDYVNSFIQPTRLFMDLVQSKTAYRSLFVTRSKRLLGLGAQSVRKGDEIWLFRGAKVLYIVRPVRMKRKAQMRKARVGKGVKRMEAVKMRIVQCMNLWERHSCITSCKVRV